MNNGVTRTHGWATIWPVETEPDPHDVFTIRCALQARRALAARVETHHHVVARPYGRTVRPNLFDNASAFMSQYTRHRDLVIAVAGSQVRMADSRRDHAHDNLVRSGLIEIDFLDHKRLSWCPHHGCLDPHPATLPSCGHPDSIECLTPANDPYHYGGCSAVPVFEALLIREREKQLIAVGIVDLDHVITPPRFLARNRALD